VIKNGDSITDDEACQTCRCIDGSVTCSEQTCPPASCSNPTQHGCCPVCDGCLVDRQTYGNGDPVPSERRCEQCKCKNGDVICGREECPHITCDNPIPGECCDSCEEGCYINGQQYGNGEPVPSSQNCADCRCNRGNLECERKRCPELFCHNPIPGKCCDSCDGCLAGGVTYADGETIPGRSCESCICSLGDVVCERQRCPVPDCDNPIPGECCDTCDGGCFADGITYADGETVSRTQCETCQCQRGSLVCERQRCPRPDCEHPVPGECCPSCDSGCLINGETFADRQSISTGRCETCQCLRGNIICQPLECPPVQCHNPTQGPCCKRCDRGCLVNGTVFNNGDLVPSSAQCKTCYCYRGSVECGPMSCPPLHPTSTEETCECCPRSCPGSCVIDSEIYRDRDAIPVEGCVECECREGAKVCQAKRCPPVFCSHPVRGECCMSCDQGCMIDGVMYEEGEAISRSDPCTSCHCNRGECLTLSPKPELNGNLFL